MRFCLRDIFKLHISKQNEKHPYTEAGNVPKSTLLKSIPKAKEERIEQIWGSLDLQGIESWNEQQ